VRLHRVTLLPMLRASLQHHAREWLRLTNTIAVTHLRHATHTLAATSGALHEHLPGAGPGRPGGRPLRQLRVGQQARVQHAPDRTLHAQGRASLPCMHSRASATRGAWHAAARALHSTMLAPAGGGSPAAAPRR